MNALRLLLEQFGRLFRWWVTICPWEMAVRVRLGKHVKVLGPGIHLKIPFADQAFCQNTRLMVIDASRQALSTLDHKTLTVSIIVGYRVVDIERLYLNIQHVENTVLNMVMGSVSRYVCRARSEECTAEQIEKAVLDDLPDTWGLAFETVAVNDLAFATAFRLLGETYSQMHGGGATDMSESKGSEVY